MINLQVITGKFQVNLTYLRCALHQSYKFQVRIENTQWVEKQKGLTISHIDIQLDPFASKLMIHACLVTWRKQKEKSIGYPCSVGCFLCMIVYDIITIYLNVCKWMNGALGHNSAPKATLGQGQSGLMRWILVGIMPLVQGWSLDMLICSPVHFLQWVMSISSHILSFSFE